MAEQQQTAAPELTVEQRIAALEQRIETFPPELRAQFQEMLELTRNYERCRANELATKVTLPVDHSRWRVSGPPPSPSAAPAELSPERPSGWARFDPLSSPPGIDMIDRMVEADTARQRADAIAAEVQRRQAIIDIFHEAQVADKERARAAAERRSFHKSPDDDDFNLR
jgi:hypothetical protein